MRSTVASMMTEYNMAFHHLRNTNRSMLMNHKPTMDIRLSGACATTGYDANVMCHENMEFELVGFGGLDDDDELGAAFIVYTPEMVVVIPLSITTARQVLGTSISEVFKYCDEYGQPKKRESGFEGYDDHSSWG